MGQQNQNPMITLNLTASDVENVLVFLNRANLPGSESELHARIKQDIARQARQQLEARDVPDNPGGSE